MMEGNPCKVNDQSLSKTGKHGSAKANIVGVDIMTGRKYQDVQPGSATMLKFDPKKVEYEVADISDGTITAMDDEGSLLEFIVPENVRADLMEWIEMLILWCSGEGREAR